MFRRIRALMATPFARPPGRRGLWARFAPEWCALAVYGLFAVVVAFSTGGEGGKPVLVCGDLHDLGEAALRAAAAAYGLAGLILLVLPVVLAARCLAAERSLGTVESLLLTPLDHQLTVRGRFWHALMPWVRFSIYLAPLYVVGAFSEFGSRMVSRDGWFLGSVLAFSPRYLATAVGIEEARRGMEFGWGTIPGLLIAGVRFVNDFSKLYFCAATAFWVSARTRRAGLAIAWSFLLAVGWMLTLGSLDFWWMVGSIGLIGFGRVGGAIAVGGAIGLALMLARFGLGFLLVRWAARRFEGWTLKEVGEQ